MSRLKYIKDMSLKEITFKRVYEAVKNRIDDRAHAKAWATTELAKQNREKLKSFHNIHKGKRCFIIANGPSLKNTDLSLLKDEYTIGMNRIYLNGFKPSYLVVFDIDIQLVQFQEDYDNLEMTKFFNWNAREYFTFRENLAYIRADHKPAFSTDVSKTTWGGHSVTNTCIQLAYYMGFSEVYLVGKDHSYDKVGVPGAIVISNGNEGNHFVKGYYKPGMAWRIPDYKGEELAYTMAREAYEKDGRKIYDATIDGKLDIFTKVDYYSLFK
ncbi:6-hydroxymethylpterin diphosphokinase MptE-like protein [Mucilaginibacter angelicae]|uniref:6-hydroxymethylpterin diphosphokinase MptE-like protein n=1 Tax=Mucilaginibacter angelicae TaxID=869718 RepID=A0ABV6LA11_9SPHI